MWVEVDEIGESVGLTSMVLKPMALTKMAATWMKEMRIAVMMAL